MKRIKYTFTENLTHETVYNILDDISESDFIDNVYIEKSPDNIYTVNIKPRNIFDLEDAFVLGMLVKEIFNKHINNKN